MHDAIVSSILYRFSTLEFINNTEINYQSIDFNQTIFSTGVDPDGMIAGSRRGKAYNVAVEVELTRKNSTEIYRKYQLYDQNTSYTWTLYFFKSLRTLESYFKYYNNFREQRGIKMEKSQILFFYSDNLARSSFDLLECYWHRPDGVPSKLKHLFLPGEKVPTTCQGDSRNV